MYLDPQHWLRTVLLSYKIILVSRSLSYQLRLRKIVGEGFFSSAHSYHIIELTFILQF